jgi:hypothetical protein
MLWNKKKIPIEKIELNKDGFKIIYDEEITEFHWLEILKITGFKVDRFTTDDICLKIESNKKTSQITEDLKGWRIFMNKMLMEFPQIDKTGKGLLQNQHLKEKKMNKIKIKYNDLAQCKLENLSLFTALIAIN